MTGPEATSKILRWKHHLRAFRLEDLDFAVDSRAVTYRHFEITDATHLQFINADEKTANFDVQFYSNFALSENDLSFVAVDQNQSVIGYILGSRAAGAEPYTHICAISVSQEYRGTDVARTLIRLFEDASKHIGVKYYDLFVDETNEPALKFYKKRGCIPVSTLYRYYGNGNNALQLVKYF